MLTPADIDLTLPSIIAYPGGRHTAQELLLTIIFHPDTGRIGQKAVVPRQTGNAPWVLGRRSPVFHGADATNPCPLEDPHLSRRALQFIYQGKRLTILRFASASRCRVGPAELFDSVEVDWEQLCAGVPLLLGHSIVLLLRLGPGRAQPPTVSASDDLLRGSSACMDGIRDQVARAAASDLDVLIRGETGTGKELVAMAIHTASRRAGQPLVSVNMAAIPAELAAAALFGSARGAYTGADKAATGYFEQAGGGCLFLDEIGDASAEVQPQLLRALQQREIQVVGGAIRQVDVRVISATDAALEGENCDFKAALRHRLGACEILLPPLREHPEDVGELLLYFLRKCALEAGRTDLLPDEHSTAPDIAAWAMLFFNFLRYHWPGNVRELANFAQQLVLASERAPTLNENLQVVLARIGRQAIGPAGSTLRRKMQDIDDDTFDRSMRANGYEVQRVARELCVSRAAVYRRIAASSLYRLVSEISRDELQRVLLERAGDCEAVAGDLRVPLNSLRHRLRTLRLQ